MTKIKKEKEKMHSDHWSAAVSPTHSARLLWNCCFSACLTEQYHPSCYGCKCARSCWSCNRLLLIFHELAYTRRNTLKLLQNKWVLNYCQTSESNKNIIFWASAPAYQEKLIIVTKLHGFITLTSP